MDNGHANELTVERLPAITFLDAAEQAISDDSATEETARGLVHAAAYLLENAPALDAARGIHDALRRAQVFFEQHKATLHATNLLVSQRVRTEWHIGKALAELPRENGGRGNVSHDGNSFLLSLATAGISESKAYRWQEIAKQDAQDLELYFEERQAQGEEISTSGVLAYFTKHVTVDMDAPEDDAPGDPPEPNDDLPQIRVVTIVCRHCGTKDAYEVA